MLIRAKAIFQSVHAPQRQDFSSAHTSTSWTSKPLCMDRENKLFSKYLRKWWKGIKIIWTKHKIIIVNLNFRVNNVALLQSPNCRRRPRRAWEGRLFNCIFQVESGYDSKPAAKGRRSGLHSATDSAGKLTGNLAWQCQSQEVRLYNEVGLSGLPPWNHCMSPTAGGEGAPALYPSHTDVHLRKSPPLHGTHGGILYTETGVPPPSIRLSLSCAQKILSPEGQESALQLWASASRPPARPQDWEHCYLEELSCDGNPECQGHSQAGQFQTTPQDPSHSNF